MLSGIGDSTHLSKFNITTLVDLPGVGKHLSDHALLDNIFTVNANWTLENILRNATLFNESETQWIENKTGAFSSTGSNQISWFRDPEDADIWETEIDPSPGSSAPHIEFLYDVRAIALHRHPPPAPVFRLVLHYIPLKTIMYISPTYRKLSAHMSRLIRRRAITSLSSQTSSRPLPEAP